LIVDDHRVVRQGLHVFLDLEEDILVVGEAADGAEAVEEARKVHPDVILMDLVMPRVDGIAAMREIQRFDPRVKIIVLTTFAEDDKVFPALRAGATGYLLKDIGPQELAEAIRAAYRGEPPLAPQVARKLMRQAAASAREEAPVEELTERELEVLRLLARGMTNREIAEELVISVRTVKGHVSNILGKLGVTDRTQAALYAVRKGLVE